jgi:hypothetical protein
VVEGRRVQDRDRRRTGVPGRDDAAGKSGHQRAVCSARGRKPHRAHAGRTTAVAALCRGDQVELACVGDSRAYLVTPCGTGS